MASQSGYNVPLLPLCEHDLIHWKTDCSTLIARCRSIVDAGWGPLTTTTLSKMHWKHQWAISSNTWSLTILLDSAAFPREDQLSMTAHSENTRIVSLSFFLRLLWTSSEINLVPSLYRTSTGFSRYIDFYHKSIIFLDHKNVLDISDSQIIDIQTSVTCIIALS